MKLHFTIPRQTVDDEFYPNLQFPRILLEESKTFPDPAKLDENGYFRNWKILRLHSSELVIDLDDEIRREKSKKTITHSREFQN